MARCIALAAAVVALFALPSAFVPARQGAPAVSPAVAAGVAAGSMALPAWAYDMADAQILLARVPGGKRTKELGLVVPIPEEDGLTDGQIAALFVVALVGLIAAVDLGKTLYYGINPTKFKTAKGKGSITPFMKRLIENGYWATGPWLKISTPLFHPQFGTQNARLDVFEQKMACGLWWGRFGVNEVKQHRNVT